MLNDFAEKKETFFLAIKNKIFTVQKIAYFQRGQPMLLTQKCEFFSLFTIDRLEIMLGDFAEKKETFLTIKNRLFQSPKNRIFPKG